MLLDPAVPSSSDLLPSRASALSDIAGFPSVHPPDLSECMPVLVIVRRSGCIHSFGEVVLGLLTAANSDLIALHFSLSFFQQLPEDHEVRVDRGCIPVAVIMGVARKCSRVDRFS
ncbi:unnamed protein product [Prorocentrum cordatum]|uniref:Uncharacterized protein n=1 Tax=Prorocentrum cordatum TaxID=2364126 RepID=A0ABN9WK39_9DINO|nr:unnamed protein product [Polarella glacialis]